MKIARSVNIVSQKQLGNAAMLILKPKNNIAHVIDDGQILHMKLKNVDHWNQVSKIGKLMLIWELKKDKILL